MPSSYTDLGIELMVTGENSGTWGDKTNTNLNIINQAAAGYQSISIAGGANTTVLDITDGSSDLTGNTNAARNLIIELTGTITGNQVVTVPDSVEKSYIIKNNTTGAFTVEFKTASGTGTTFSATDKGIKFLYADGTNVIDINANLSVSSFEQINLPTQNELRFEDASGGEYVGLKAASTVSASYTLTLPTADGTSGQAILTNGSGVLSFGAAGISTGKAIAMAIVFG
jgi:hypothetical protein